MTWLLSWHWWNYVLVYGVGAIGAALLLGFVFEDAMGLVGQIAIAMFWPVLGPFVLWAMLLASIVQWARDL